MRNLDFFRKRFESAKAQSRNPQNAPQFSQIRQLVKFEKGKTVYNIDIKSISHKLNRALKDNDKFVVASVYAGIMVSDDAMPGHAPVLLYPLIKGTAVTASGLKGLDNFHANVMYNGDWSLRTNQEVNYQGFPMSVFLKQPETNPVAQYSSDLEAGSFAIPEEITLSGQQDHEIRVEIPATADTDIKGESGTTAYLVFGFYGWTIQGAAK